MQELTIIANHQVHTVTNKYYLFATLFMIIRCLPTWIVFLFIQIFQTYFCKLIDASLRIYLIILNLTYSYLL